MAVTIQNAHYCLAPNELTDVDLEERFEAKQLQSITKMSGIHTRRVVSPGVTACDLAEVAVRRLVAAKFLDLARVDLLVFATQTPDYQIPGNACVLHGRLGLAHACAAFDINLGCSAFPYALAVVHSMLKAGVARTALLCHGDAISSVLHPRDRSLVPLHGDAAAVYLLQHSESASGFDGFLLGTNGADSQKISMPASGMQQKPCSETKFEQVDTSGNVRTLEHLQMNGPAVFHFSLKVVPQAIQRYLKQQHLQLDQMDLVLLHQANKTMVDLIYRALKVPQSKRFYFMENVGNLAGASTPVLLVEAWRTGRLRPGVRVLIASFGNGLSWGVTSLVWSAMETACSQGSVEYDPKLLGGNLTEG